MKILVTGGTGFIGSHTAVELIQAGYDVELLDNLSNSHGWIADRVEKICGKQVPLHRINLADREAVIAFFGEHHGYDGVIHFAALKAVGESVQQPLRYYRNNIFGLVNLLEAMDLHGITTLVFSSSCTVYGIPDKLPVDEQAPVQPPLSPYGYTKQVAEGILRDTSSAGKLRCIALRYFNPAGAHESALIGEIPMGIPDNLMPYITQTAIGKRKELQIFGSDYNTPDGTAIRDYLHVTDLALAHLAALKRIMNSKEAPSFEVFNLGTGRGFSVLEMVHTFEQVTGKMLPYRMAPRRQGDIPAIWANPSLANKLLGWKTERTLEEMVLSAWKWEIAEEQST